MALRAWWVILAVFCCAEAAGQQLLRAIEFEGQRRSKPVYLHNFVHAEVGVAVDSVRLAQDAQNLLNTNLFSWVEVDLRDTLEGVKAVYRIKEKWTRYPAGNGGIIDENFWVELGWRDNHFLGRGIRWSVLVKYYDRFSVNGFFRAPYWFGKNWGMEASWDFGRTIEPIQLAEHWVEDYNQDKVMANLLFSYALKPSNFLYAGYEIEISDYRNRYGGQLGPAASQNEVQRMHRLVLRHHNRHNLNISEQYLTGWANEAIVKMGLVPDGKRWYPYVQNDLKLFLKPWKTANLGNRLRVGWGENHPSVFAPFVQDSFLNIRGVGNKPFRGTAELTNNLELRQTIYDRHWLALQAVAFCDYSVVRAPGSKSSSMFDAGNHRAYAGIGGRIFFKNAFDFILRADYGISLTDKRGGFVLGLGQYF